MPLYSPLFAPEPLEQFGPPPMSPGDLEKLLLQSLHAGDRAKAARIQEVKQRRGLRGGKKKPLKKAVSTKSKQRGVYESAKAARQQLLDALVTQP